MSMYGELVVSILGNSSTNKNTNKADSIRSLIGQFNIRVEEAPFSAW